MNSMKARATIWIVIIWIIVVSLAKEAHSQTVELRSTSLTVLSAAERERFLTTHNVARKSVGVESVKWSDEVGQQALASLRQQQDALIAAAKEGWSQGLAVLPQHSDQNEYGENVAAWVGRRSQSAELAVDLWLREKAAFDKLNVDDAYRVGDEEGQTEIDELGKERPIVVGHYTAIVWSTTTHIGAAKLSFELTDDQGTTRYYAAIVCNYSPAGNRQGQKPY
jgi:pathogenesis-related protein 1